MVQEWSDKSASDADGLQGNLALLKIWDWKNVMGGVRDKIEISLLTVSVKVTRAQEKTYAIIFKKPRTCKIGYQTIRYLD